MISIFGKRWKVAAWLTFVTLAAVSARADYEFGQAAWDAGSHAEAVAAWQEAARENDARAMLALGRAFERGVGVLQDFVEAHKWLILAAGLGDVDAADERDALAAEMTVEERAEARGLARAWRSEATPPAADAGSHDPPQTPSDATSSAGAPPERALREAQSLLTTLGYAPGPADGKWGRRSVEAYRGFLGDAGMEPSDVLTPEALQAMREKARPVANVTVAPAHPLDALHQAVQAGDLDALATALKAGRDANQRDGRGWTPLMHAANQGYVLMMSPLLEAGADVDLRAADGATALFMATAHGHSGIIELLSRKGADVSIEGPQGKTAVDVARARYGDVDAARANGESPAVLALLQGGTLLEIEDEAAFARAEALGTHAAYEDYLTAYPTGHRSGSAQAALQELQDIALFEQAQAQETAEAYEAYLEAFPTGLFVDQVRSLLNLFELLPKSSQGGRTFRDCDACPEMVALPPGAFMMGSLYSQESPVHRVTIPAPFAVGKYEVTFAERDACVADGGCGHRPDDSSWGRSERPAINVSWNDAQTYIDWLSRRTGKAYRLLSEAEWEYAARAGSQTQYAWGDEIGRGRANCDKCGSRWDNQLTAPVGSFAPNAFGLHDLHGNVWEWVEDCWNDSYVGAPSDGTAWTSGDCNQRTLRGGSWGNAPAGLRSAFRHGGAAGDRTDLLGLRVARAVTL